MFPIKTRILIIFGQLIFLSSCIALPQATETITPSHSNFDGQVTVVAPSLVEISDSKIEAVIDFFDKHFEYMPLLNTSLIPPHHIYYGCLNSEDAGVILNYEIKSSLETFYPLFEDEFNSENWTYESTGIIEDDLNHRIVFFTASTIQYNSTTINVRGEIFESLSASPERLNTTVTFTYLSNSINRQTFENNLSNDLFIPNPKSTLLDLCANEHWSLEPINQ